MKSPTLIVWLLIGAFIAIDLAMIGELQIRQNLFPEAGGLIGIALSFSQVGLVALWVVWGRSSILLRGVSSLLGVWAVSCLAAFSSTGRLQAASIWFGMLVFYCCVSVVLCVIARFAGYAMTNREWVDPTSVNSRLSTNQFTIWGILSLMTTVGVVLAVARFVRFPMREPVEAGAFFALLATTGCTVLLLALCLSKIRNAFIAAALICPLAGILLSLTGLAPGDGQIELTLIVCVQGAVSLSAVAVLRTAGYRLARDSDPREVTASRSTDVSKLEPEDQDAEP